MDTRRPLRRGAGTGLTLLAVAGLAGALSACEVELPTVGETPTVVEGAPVEGSPVEGAPAVPPPTIEVVVGGDSLTFQADVDATTSEPNGTTLVQDALRVDHHGLAFAAVPGAGSEVLDALAADGAGDATILVVNTGTNDSAGFLWTYVHVRSAMERIDPDCVVFTTVNETPAYGIDQWAPAVNAWYRAGGPHANGAGPAYPYVVNEWATGLATHPAWYLSDQVHMTAAGRDAFRRSIDEGVGACAAQLA